MKPEGKPTEFTGVPLGGREMCVSEVKIDYEMQPMVEERAKHCDKHSDTPYGQQSGDTIWGKKNKETHRRWQKEYSYRNEAPE